MQRALHCGDFLLVLVQSLRVCAAAVLLLMESAMVFEKTSENYSSRLFIQTTQEIRSVQRLEREITLCCYSRSS
ncbi:hypothetical protein WS93_22375 [Burkholderia cepacia]|nr:hypothetical protein WS93_22375 [Burkholderia cepacia]